MLSLRVKNAPSRSEDTVQGLRWRRGGFLHYGLWTAVGPCHPLGFWLLASALPWLGMGVTPSLKYTSKLTNLGGKGKKYI